ncbi:MAG: sugar phosphate nucleotidyltransferase [Acidobacteria bacterium]|nr:sugar phosphate nucleotidyltransferase [Acidobacteriota bacterium]
MILAGGTGTRLWPLARETRPKQFLKIIGGRSLFDRTMSRARSLVGPGRIIIVGGVGHRLFLRAQAKGIDSGQIILEGIGRNTAASIALAALRIRAGHGDGVMIVFPSDHWIDSKTKFRAVIRSAVTRARRTDGLYIIGVPPRSADSGFGYVLPAERGNDGQFRRVAAFVEKPPPGVAARMVRSGRYLWNSGIFVWRASAILDQLKRHRPGVVRAAATWAGKAGRGLWTVPTRVMRRMESVPIDRAVLERSRSTWVRRADFGWSDLGNWAALADLLGGARRGNASLGPHRFIDSSGCLAVGGEGPIVMLGVKDLIAVRDGGTLLVCHRDAVQKVREVAEQMAGRDEGPR